MITEGFYYRSEEILSTPSSHSTDPEIALLRKMHENFSFFQYIHETRLTDIKEPSLSDFMDSIFYRLNQHEEMDYSSAQTQFGIALNAYDNLGCREEYVEYLRNKSRVSIEFSELQEDKIPKYIYNTCLNNEVEPYLIGDLSTAHRTIYSNYFTHHFGIDPFENSCYMYIPIRQASYVVGMMKITCSEIAINEFSEIAKNIFSSTQVIRTLIGHLYKQHSFALYNQLIPPNPEATHSYNHSCNSIVTALNCLGCIIRFPNPITGRMSIQGYSDNVQSVKELVESYLFDLNNDVYARQSVQEQLGLIFNNNNIQAGENDDIYKVVAISIMLDLNLQKVESYKLYFEKGLGQIRECSDGTQMGFIQYPSFSQILPEEYISQLCDLGAKEVLIVSIPHVNPIKNNGIITFANTVFKKFQIDDIAFLYGEAKRLAIQLQRLKSESILYAARTITHTAEKLPDQISTLINSREKLIVKLDDFTNIEEHSLDFVDSLKAIRKIVYEQYNCDTLLIEEVNNLARFYAKRMQMLESIIVSQNTTISGFQDTVHDIGECLDRCIKCVRPLAKVSRGIDILCNTELSKEMVSLNSDLLEVVFIELLENAVKYSFKHPKGQIEVNVPTFNRLDSRSEGHIHISLHDIIHESKTYIEFKITNWGVPIPPNLYDKIFLYGTVFVGPQGQEIDHKSKGIGLYGVKTFLNEMNGSIKVSSDMNKSSNTFTILLPVR
jgi:signal transduction histidine kinase